MTTYRIDGARVDSIAALYEQLDAVLNADADWTLGPSLDGLDDVLYGIDGTPEEPTLVVWTDHAHSRAALGRDATVRWLRSKLDPDGPFDRSRFARELDEVERGGGVLYVDRVLEVFADHPGIRVDLA
ncbi:barstar family protein [Brachybacterium sp. AOP25-B2-12]|uniref:barstar family protein n=1 Tax=Brachybacterium sp. AOP25-B2-12 TaxID=3457710 RepID=UPI0040332781